MSLGGSSRRVAMLALAVLAGATPMVGAQPASVAQYDLCARGLNHDLQAPFLQTLRVKLSITGPAIDEGIRKEVQAQLILATVWPGRATEVFVEDFDVNECAASADNQVDVTTTLTQADLDAIREQVGRGPGLIERVVEVARQAGVRPTQGRLSEEAQKRWLRVFYATNRQAMGNPSTHKAFGKERAEALSYGSVEVAVLHQKEMKDLESPAVFKFERSTSLDNFSVAGGYVTLSREKWLAELKQRASRFEQPGVLLFIHGYNVSFVDAARRSAQLAYDMAFPGPTLFFAWPSDVTAIKYLHDGRDAENSWPAAASVLADVTSLLPNGPVYVVAHSMGNRVMLGGLTRLLEELPGRRRAISAVVMAAPDVDQDSFRLNIASKVLNLGIPFTLYASEHDLALSASEFLQGGKRLGMGGSDLFIMNGIDSVDASAVAKEFFALNHAYFGDKTALVSDLFYLIRLGLPPGRRPNLRQLQALPVPSWAIK